PGSVSTSRSRIVSFCFCAKLRTCACANLMSSRSRLATWLIARSISAGVRRKSGGDQLSNFCDRSRTAVSLRASMSVRISSTVWRTLASAALIALASIPRLSQRVMVSLPYMTPAASLDRLRVDRRASAAGDQQRRPAEEELVDAVLGAVLGQ